MDGGSGMKRTEKPKDDEVEALKVGQVWQSKHDLTRIVAVVAIRKLKHGDAKVDKAKLQLVSLREDNLSDRWFTTSELRGAGYAPIAEGYKGVPT